MKNLVITFLVVLVALTSCKKEEPKVQIFKAMMDGKQIDFLGAQIQKVEVYNQAGDFVRYNYWLTNNLYILDEEPVAPLNDHQDGVISIKFQDSTFVKKKFLHTELDVRYDPAHVAQPDDSLNLPSVIAYYAVGGELEITKEENNIIYGTFDLQLAAKFALWHSDTLELTDGYFEITQWPEYSVTLNN